MQTVSSTIRIISMSETSSVPVARFPNSLGKQLISQSTLSTQKYFLGPRKPSRKPGTYTTRFANTETLQFRGHILVPYKMTKY